jgi:GT2 family glycosyltransferase
MFEGCGSAVDDIDVSVVMACYTEERIDSIKSALTSLRKQSLEPRGVVVAVDNNEKLAKRLMDEFDWITVVLNQRYRGSSATRNCGAEVVDTSITAFLDDDEAADVDWLRELARPFSDPTVVGTGGKYEAVWSSGKPRWFPDEFAWAVGASYAGMPTEAAEVRNVWSGNMAVRTAVFRQVNGFRTEFGKRGSISHPEDTDLCIRMSAVAGGRWVYIPSAVIHHDVPTARASLGFLSTRCFAEGGGKALMSLRLDSTESIDIERGYVQATALTALRRVVSGQRATSAQGVVMLIGLISAVAGYVSVRLRAPRMPDIPTVVLREGDKKPALVVDYELSTPLSALAEDVPELDEYERVWTILRTAGRPIAMVDTAASIPDIEDAVIQTMQGELADRIAVGADDSVTIGDSGDLHPSPSVSVVICTRERPIDLARALDSLEAQTYRDFTVVIVDNVPISSETRDVADRYRDHFPRLLYVVEPKPGLSHARNCALRHVDTEVVAWLDDDENADSTWLSEIVNVFRIRPDTAAVSGTVIPAELETWPQWWFEQYGGHSKGRGFERAVFAHGDTGDQSPLYPLPPFGVGANMAFRTEVLQGIGGFDNGLGAGTLTFGGEDVLAFSQLLLSGYTVVYEPAAMTRHFHRRTYDALERQMYGYGVGLTAYYVALLRWDWRLIFPLFGLVPRALVDMLGRDSAITTALPQDFPSGLFGLKRRGMLMGPIAYWRARRSAHRELDRR